MTLDSTEDTLAFTVGWVARMATTGARREAASALATSMGGEQLLIFVRDPELSILLPAPGFQQTLPGGPAWCQILEACNQPGTFRAEVPFPTLRETVSACAVCIPGGTAAILLGGEARAERMESFLRLLPVLGAMFQCELSAKSASGQVQSAREAAQHAHTLAASLDKTRGELERALTEAGRLNQQLTDADLRKDEFLAMLAHELRNPLSPMITALHLFQRRQPQGSPPTRELEIVSRQLSQLTRLIDDLMDVSRITRGRVELREERSELSEILSRAIETTIPTIEARRHKLSVTGTESPVFLMVDSVRMTQVFSNLLHNAAKYSDPNGQIRVVVQSRAKDVRIRIEDEGVGMSAEVLPRVFDLFVQAPRSLDRAQGGLGIGLSVVRGLVELHGGEVTASSAGLGKGSQFEVTLPIVEPPAVAAEPPTLPQAPVAPVRAMRVLIVEDSKDAAETLAELLELQGHSPQIAHHGLMALEIASSFRPEVVLLDIGLPGMDGLEVARRMRLMLRDVRLVALSGYGQEKDRQNGRDAGFDDYLVKPVDLELLAQVMSPSPRTV